MADNTYTPGSPKPKSSETSNPETQRPEAPASPHSPEPENSQQPGAQEQVRWSTYAENRPNPLPQFLDPADRAPEVVSNLSEPKDEAEVDPFAGVPVTRPPRVEPDGPDPRSPAVVFAEPKQSWAGKRRNLAISLVILFIIVLVGTVVGVVVGNRLHSGGGGGST